MGERKVLNKHYPSDFDPSKLPRVKQPKNRQITVRIMLPMTIRCGTCGNYIYKGTKFNSRKEDVIGETYLGIQIFRFYFKCTRCSTEIAMKTNPQCADYTVDSGASRNLEHWQVEEDVVEREKKKRATEEIGDAIKRLEYRTIDAKREMDIMALLDELKSMKSKQANLSLDQMLGALQRAAEEKEKKMKEEDEALIKSIFSTHSKVNIKRILDEYMKDDEYNEPSSSSEKSNQTNSPSKKLKVSHEKASNALTKASITETTSKFIITNVVKVAVGKEPLPKGEHPPARNTSAALSSLCQDYADDEDSDEDS